MNANTLKIRQKLGEKITKEDIMQQLGSFDRVNIRTNNSCIIYFENGTVLQSYDSIIVINLHGVIILGQNYDYSTTTGKHRNEFLNETLQETRKKIQSGEYIYVENLS